MTHGKLTLTRITVLIGKVKTIFLTEIRLLASNFAASSESYDGFVIADRIVGFYRRHGTASLVEMGLDIHTGKR